MGKGEPEWELDAHSKITQVDKSDNFVATKTHTHTQRESLKCLRLELGLEVKLKLGLRRLELRLRLRLGPALCSAWLDD